MNERRVVDEVTALEAIARVRSRPEEAALALLAIAGGWQSAQAWCRERGIDEWWARASRWNVAARAEMLEAIARAVLHEFESATSNDTCERDEDER
jgi:hypothetical protein